MLPYTVFVIAEALVLAWVFCGTGGSVLLVALLHGMSNVAMLLFGGLDPRWMPWFKSSIAVLVALAVFFWFGPDLVRRPREVANEET